MSMQKEIDNLISELTALKQYKGDVSELEKIIGPAAKVVAHFNEEKEVRAKAIAEWAHENDDLEKTAKKALDDMNEGSIGDSFYL